MAIKLKYVRDSIVRIIELAGYKNLKGVIACYNANVSANSVDLTMSVLPLYEDNIFPDIISTTKKSNFINVAKKVFEIERPNNEIFHEEHFKNSFDGSNGEHFILDIQKGSIINYNDESIKIANNNIPIEVYFEDLDSEIEKNSEMNYNLLMFRTSAKFL